MILNGSVQSVFSNLMKSGSGQPGFRALMAATPSRPDLTVENHILSPEWSGCYSEEVRASAQFRLAKWEQLP